MPILFPRINKMAVEQILDLIEANTSHAEIQASFVRLPNSTTFAAVGGSRAPSELYVKIRGVVVDVARRHGFPNEGRSTDRAGFDAEAAEALAGIEELHSGEALRDDVWAFLTSLILHDVARWRFGLSRERFHGGVRNTFQRLWMRAEALDRGESHADRWGLLRELTEDALVQIVERPSLGSRPILARAIGEGWVRASRQFGRGMMEPVMRRVAMSVRLKNEVIAMSALEGSALEEAIDLEFQRAVATIRSIPAT